MDALPADLRNFEPIRLLGSLFLVCGQEPKALAKIAGPKNACPDAKWIFAITGLEF